MHYPLSVAPAASRVAASHQGGDGHQAYLHSSVGRFALNFRTDIRLIPLG